MSETGSLKGPLMKLKEATSSLPLSSFIHPLHDLCRQTKHLTPPPPPKLSRNSPTNPRPQGFLPIVQEHTGIIVEANHAAIGTLQLLLCANHDGVPHIAAADLGRGRGGRGAEGNRAGFLDDDDDLVA